VYQEKIQKILDWPTPISVIDLWGFFWLCNYYKRFVKGFSQLGVPLIDLTKNSAFKWSKKAHDAFHRVNKVMSTCPMLALPYFSRPFLLECDPSEEGIEAMLMYNQHPIDFKRRNMRKTGRLYPIYDKDMLDIMHALAKFRQHLVGGCFVLRTDHNILRYYLEQTDLRERQQK
jgi:hypothetical protein